MTTGFRPSPAQPNPPMNQTLLKTAVLHVSNKEKPMKYLKKLWKKYMDWLFKDFYK